MDVFQQPAKLFRSNCPAPHNRRVPENCRSMRYPRLRASRISSPLKGKTQGKASFSYCRSRRCCTAHLLPTTRQAPRTPSRIPDKDNQKGAFFPPCMKLHATILALPELSSRQGLCLVVVRVHRFGVQRSRLGTKTKWTTPNPAEADFIAPIIQHFFEKACRTFRVRDPFPRPDTHGWLFEAFLRQAEYSAVFGRESLSTP
jgi:hypothetical protein